ncbi:hypothetical protein, variant [Aphanomyces invadans]|uniref:RRM domain-containing protein n=1 Tax=Aphanomyces invadans TaxID=157072 RepID=A0A024UH12_9STRA|nr:hypothetical protein, variant [Aphanomyces invadans]ETW05716.1 hypothetical protein, variant [Aphanomyces invadans]|eukprot:XP_008865493.1 hypothetical protein, variant [Aphanomyces invadans]
MATFQTLPTSSWADEVDDFEVPVPVAAPAAAAPVREVATRVESPRRLTSPRNSRPGQHDDYDAPGHGARGRRYSGDNFDRRDKLPVPDVGPFKSYVGNLPYAVHPDDLVDLFAGCNIQDIRLPQDHSGRPKGFAYVEFGDRESLMRALELDGETLNQRTIRVDVAGDRKGGRNDNGFFHKRDGGDRYGGDRYQREDRYGRDDRGPQRSDGHWGADRRRENRGDRRAPRDDIDHQPTAPAERPKLTLKPRTKSKEDVVEGGARPANVFGDAKPRDETKVKASADRPAAMDARLESGDRRFFRVFVVKRTHGRDQGPRRSWWPWPW